MSISSSSKPIQHAADEEIDDEEQLDLKLIESFAQKIQHSDEVRPQISIPRRGEKDFEPLAETSRLQEMMLQRSREALFGALQGVRGGSSKSISQAVLTPRSPYPHMLVTRGHLMDAMGITIREGETSGQEKGKGKAQVQLLPEEALFLLERGSLQIWMGDGAWDDDTWSVPGAVEMSVAEAFAAFLGQDGLTWERYQAYAVLKRLGYTVQRARRFIPHHFRPDGYRRDPFQSWWWSIPRYIRSVFTNAYQYLSRSLPSAATLLSDIRGATYATLLCRLRISSTGHKAPLMKRRDVPNPYLPFYHVWKPAYPWTKNKWDKGSDAGLHSQPPNYFVAAINARSEPMPTIQQLSQVFEELPDEPRGPVKRQGPQYRQPDPNRSARPNPMAELRNGDRALIVAVNDSGNTGWVRFGRSWFADIA